MKVKNTQVFHSLRQSSQFELALDTIQILKSAGHLAVLAGGCVRDALMGIVPYDLDIATSATPEQVAKLFENTLLIGAQFGVVVRNAKLSTGEPIQIEIASFRTDGLYVDGRRPDHVTFSTPEMDAERRDFTCNALFYDIDEQAVWDFVGGLEDISKKSIRAVGDAHERLNEDYLRSLRAVRFVSQLSFELDLELRAALSLQSDNLLQISMERKVDELYKMLRGSQPVRAFERLDEFNFWKGIHRKLRSVTHLWREIDNQLSQELRWIYFWMLEISLTRAENLSPKTHIEWLVQQLKVSHAEAKIAFQLSELCMKISSGVEIAPIEIFKLKPLARDIERLEDQIRYLGGDGRGVQIRSLGVTHESVSIESKVDMFFENLIKCRSFEPVLLGDDLVSLGVKPGPKFRQWLDRAFILQWEAEGLNKNGADKRAVEFRDRETLRSQILNELKKEINS